MRASLAVTPLGQHTAAFTETFHYQGARIAQVMVSGATSFSETFHYRPDGRPLDLFLGVPSRPAARYWYVLDGLGNVVGLVDQRGELVNTYSYDLWGDHERGAQDQETFPQPLRYRGY